MAAFVRLAAFCLALLAGIAGAEAHASLTGSEPADGAMLADAPQRFVLRFNEPVSPLALSLVAGDGVATPLDGIRVERNDIVVDAPPGLAHGTWALTFRVVSIDGHPIAGSVVFSVGTASGPVSSGLAAAMDGGVRGAILATRLALYAGLFLGIGGLFFAAFVGPQPAAARQVETALLVLALAALVLSVGLQGLDALGLPLAAIAEGGVWPAGFSTSWGTAVVIASGAAIAALAGLRLDATARRAAAVASLAGLGLALASTGHASAAAPQWLTRSAVFVHAVAVATWVGALVPLGLMLARGDGAARAALARFSRTIPWSVGALIVAGAVLAVIQVGRPEALVATAYGNVLLVKLALLAPLFAVALVNRLRLTVPALAGDPSAERRLARSIVVEVVLVVAILAVVAVWRLTPPPRSLAVAAAAPAVVHIHNDKAMAEVTIAPGRAGPVTAIIALQSADLGPLTANGVSLMLSMPSAGIEPIRREASDADGVWTVDRLALPVGGTWTVRVAVLVTDFDLVNLDGTVVIAP